MELSLGICEHLGMAAMFEFQVRVNSRPHPKQPNFGAEMCLENPHTFSRQFGDRITFLGHTSYVSK